MKTLKEKQPEEFAYGRWGLAFRKMKFHLLVLDLFVLENAGVCLDAVYSYVTRSRALQERVFFNENDQVSWEGQQLKHAPNA